MPIEKIIFVDTNIWLDFYRYKTEANLQLLNRLEKISKKLIVTDQLEIEYKSNRISAIKEGMRSLNHLDHIPTPGLFSDAKPLKALQKNLKVANKRIDTLKSKLKEIIKKPTTHDPVYKVCQRIFHLENKLRLKRDNKLHHIIRRRAFLRFIAGHPPRKKNDTSIGDAFNWEWMIECSKNNNAELVVSRDSDYGENIDSNTYINDYLREEFRDRVSHKRKILLYTKLTETLKHLNIKVTKKEEQEENQIIKNHENISDSISAIDSISIERTCSFCGNELIIAEDKKTFKCINCNKK